jgi:hypothetical protein
MSCTNHSALSTTQTPEGNAIAGGMAAVDAGANMGNTQSGAISSRWNLDSLWIRSAFAGMGCGGYAVQDSCSSGVKEAIYSNCSHWGGSLSGTERLTYSDSGCAMGTGSGQSITREAMLTRQGLSGGSIVTDSANTSTAYDGTEIGAGSTITYNGTAYELEIAGAHKVQSLTSGATEFDVSVMTSSPMTLTGALSGSRVVDGGSVTVYHNSAKYTAVLVPHSLTYALASCCHPVGGSIDITYSGSLTGSGTVTFPGACGTANLSINGHPELITIQGCE